MGLGASGAGYFYDSALEKCQIHRCFIVAPVSSRRETRKEPDKKVIISEELLKSIGADTPLLLKGMPDEMTTLAKPNLCPFAARYY